LYHYTSQDGLLGIIQNRKIWATNLLFLNDSMEFNYAIQILRESIEKLEEEKELNQNELHYLESSSKKLVKFNTSFYQKYGGVYMCSFSECKDQLSQWRGYCPNGSGFSIGFDFKSSLGNLVEEQDFTLVKCEYDEGKQKEMIGSFLKKTLEEFHENENDTLRDFNVWSEFLTLAPKIKNSKFKEEQEWRLVSRPKTLDFNDVKFRVGKSMLIPYIEIKLTEHQDNSKDKKLLSCIPEICFGPTLYPDLSRIALENMLKSEQVYYDAEVDGKIKKKICNVSKSDIPYRVYL